MPDARMPRENVNLHSPLSQQLAIAGFCSVDLSIQTQCNGIVFDAMFYVMGDNRIGSCTTSDPVTFALCADGSAESTHKGIN